MQTSGIRHKAPNRFYSIWISMVSNNRNITKENVKFVCTKVLVFPGGGWGGSCGKPTTTRHNGEENKLQ